MKHNLIIVIGVLLVGCSIPYIITPAPLSSAESASTPQKYRVAYDTVCKSPGASMIRPTFLNFKKGVLKCLIM